MKLAALLLAISVLLAVPSQQTAKNYSSLTITQLIDDLTTIDSSGVGYHPTASTSAFVAEDTPPRFRGGVLGSQKPTIHPAFRELVKRGAASVPELIKGLSDKRETKLKVGGKFFMFQYFSNEYDQKQQTSGKPDNQGSWNDIKERSFSGQYTVKVGDLCYAAIGQIVNRLLYPIRYQPSAGLVVNSPIETPTLIPKVVEDWSNVTSDTLKSSLISDVEVAESPYWAVSAIKRLRYYFPNEYLKLRKGKLGKKIRQAENEEAKEK